MQQLIKPYQAYLYERVIELKYAEDFDYEAIEPLALGVINTIPHCKLIEKIKGLDRLSFRCQINQDIVQLHFEVYSQSSWLELENTMDAQLLNHLMAFLSS